jgi:hypothetical protein
MSFPVHCKLTDPNAGWPGEQERARELLEKNGEDHVYTIQHMEVGQSSTKLYFYNEYLTIGYNSVQFSACDMFGNPMDTTCDCLNPMAHEGDGTCAKCDWEYTAWMNSR